MISGIGPKNFVFIFREPNIPDCKHMSSTVQYRMAYTGFGNSIPVLSCGYCKGSLSTPAAWFVPDETDFTLGLRDDQRNWH